MVCIESQPPIASDDPAKEIVCGWQTRRSSVDGVTKNRMSCRLIDFVRVLSYKDSEKQFACEYSWPHIPAHSKKIRELGFKVFVVRLAFEQADRTVRIWHIDIWLFS